MVNLNEFTAEELKALRSEVSAELKARRVKALADERKAKTEREANFKGSVAEGDVISFLFNKKVTEALVARVSEKSVTVEIDGAKKYIKYGNVLEVVKKATADADTDAKTEAVA